MSNADLIDIEGVITEVANGLYRVQCDNGHMVMARLKKRLKRHRIRVVVGDRVSVGVSPYDLTRGFITYRQR